MTGLTRNIALMIGFSVGILALGFAGAATAQENLDAGKTPAQLYASDCAICHKTTRGLSHVGGLFGLEGFLREHYTASRESAAKIAGYLRQVDRGPAPSTHRRATRSRHGKQHKAAGKKPAATKSAEKKPAAKKSARKKSAKPAEAKAVHKKSAEAKTEPKARPKAKSEAMAAPAKPSKPKATNGEASQSKTGASKSAKSAKPKDAKPVE